MTTNTLSALAAVKKTEVLFTLKVSTVPVNVSMEALLNSELMLELESDHNDIENVSGDVLPYQIIGFDIEIDLECNLAHIYYSCLAQNENEHDVIEKFNSESIQNKPYSLLNENGQVILLSAMISEIADVMNTEHC